MLLKCSVLRDSVASLPSSVRAAQAKPPACLWIRTYTEFEWYSVCQPLVSLDPNISFLLIWLHIFCVCLWRKIHCKSAHRAELICTNLLCSFGCFQTEEVRSHQLSQVPRFYPCHLPVIPQQDPDTQSFWCGWGAGWSLLWLENWPRQQGVSSRFLFCIQFKPRWLSECKYFLGDLISQALWYLLWVKVAEHLINRKKPYFSWGCLPITIQKQILLMMCPQWAHSCAYANNILYNRALNSAPEHRVLNAWSYRCLSLLYVGDRPFRVYALFSDQEWIHKIQEQK